MNQTSILFPVLALVGWTMLVLLLIPYHRFKAGFAGHVKAHDFKYGESSNVPPSVSLPNRNFMNLLEVPVLFYVVCLTLFVAHIVDTPFVYLAWVYVGLRMLHSVVHLSYNKVVHRLAVFAISNFVLLAIWIRLVITLRQVA